MKTQEFEAIQKRIEVAKRKQIEAETILKQAEKDLQENWDVDSLDGAVELLEELETELDNMEVEFEEKLNEFTTKYADQLATVSE